MCDGMRDSLVFGSRKANLTDLGWEGPGFSKNRRHRSLEEPAARGADRLIPPMHATRR